MDREILRVHTSTKNIHLNGNCAHLIDQSILYFHYYTNPLLSMYRFRYHYTVCI